MITAPTDAVHRTATITTTTNHSDAAVGVDEAASRIEDVEVDVVAHAAARADVTGSDLTITGVLVRPSRHAEHPYPKWQ